MGRGKPQLKRIENASTRQATFCKRRLDLLKRARELSSLCDADVAIIGFSSSGTLFDCSGPRSMEEIIQAYFETHAGKPFDHSAGSPFQDEIERLKEELPMLEKEEGNMMEELKLLSLMELDKLESKLVSELNCVRHEQDRLMGERREEFAKKEQELLKENEILREEELRRVRKVSTTKPNCHIANYDNIMSYCARCRVRARGCSCSAEAHGVWHKEEKCRSNCSLFTKGNCPIHRKL